MVNATTKNPILVFKCDFDLFQYCNGSNNKMESREIVKVTNNGIFGQIYVADVTDITSISN